MKKIIAILTAIIIVLTGFIISDNTNEKNALKNSVYGALDGAFLRVIDLYESQTNEEYLDNLFVLSGETRDKAGISLLYSDEFVEENYDALMFLENYIKALGHPSRINLPLDIENATTEQLDALETLINSATIIGKGYSDNKEDRILEISDTLKTNEDAKEVSDKLNAYFN